MKKLLFLAAYIFLFSSVGTYAQAKIEAPQLNVPNEKTTATREDFSKTDVKIDPSEFVEREFSGKKNDADKVKSSARRQVYLRPTREERRKRYLSDAFGVPALISSTFGAGINQIGNDPPEWRRTAGGFAKRFASSYGTNAIRNTVTYGLSEAFGLENRFEKSGQKGFGKRVKHVFLGSYTTRTRTGKRIPDFPYAIGTYTGSIVANEVWFPKRYSYQDGLRDGTISLGVRFGVNLLREFVFPK